jgi:hypothetical protein
VSEAFEGDRCERCAAGLFGDDCEALPALLVVSPPDGTELGGTTVTIAGVNLLNGTGSLLCRFGSLTAAGEWLGSDRVRCVTPQQAAATVSLELSQDGGSTYITEGTCHLLHLLFYSLATSLLTRSNRSSHRKPSRN